MEEVSRGKGLITIEDLKKYEPVLREPVSGSYRNYEILSAPPPSSGGTVLIEILNMLEGFPIGDYDFLSEETVHWMVETEKRAYSDRAKYLGDDDFIDIPLSVLLSKEYAVLKRSSIGYESTPSSGIDDGGIGIYEYEETTHYSIIDSEGTAVATTTTLNGSFGSKMMSWQVQCYAALLSRETGNPVKMIFTKEEHLAAFTY